MCRDLPTSDKRIRQSREYFLFFSFREPVVARTDQLEREARRLGQSLVRTGDEDEDDDDDDDYDDDMVDLEVSNIVFTTLLRSV